MNFIKKYFSYGILFALFFTIVPITVPQYTDGLHLQKVSVQAQRVPSVSPSGTSAQDKATAKTKAASEDSTWYGRITKGVITGMAKLPSLLLLYFANQYYMMGALCVYVGGLMLNVSLTMSVTNLNYMLPMDVITSIWGTFRDIGNSVLIFVLLFAAIKTIFGVGDSKVKATIINVFIIAVTINFSLFATRVLIDLSNITSLSIYNQIISTPATGNSLAEATNPNFGAKATEAIQQLLTQAANAAGGGVAGRYIEALGVSRVIVNPAGMGGEIDEHIKDYVFAFRVMVNASLLFWAGVLMAISSLFFIVRMVTIIFLLIFSPVALVALILPGLSKVRDMWVKNLKGVLFFPIVFFLFMYVSLRVMGSMKILPSNGNPTGVLAIFSDNAGKLFLSAAINTVFLVIPIFAATAFSFLGSGVISNLYKTAENKAKGLVARNTVGRTAKWADGKLGNTKLGNMTWMRDLRSVTTGALGNKKFFGTKNLDEQKKDDATSARLQKGLSDKQSFENNLAFIKFSQAFRGPETGAQKKNRIEKEKRALFDTEQYLKKQKAEDIWNMKDQLINNPAVAKLISDEQMKGLAESDTATTDEGKATLEALKQSRTTGKAEQFSSTDIDVNNNTVNIYAANANHTSGEKKAIREEKEKREREASKITAETAKDMISTPAFKNIAIAMKPDKLKEVILDNPAISETDKEALRKAYEAHHIANPAEIERLSTTDAAKLGENVLTDDAVLKALSPQKTLDIASKLDDQPELQDEIMSKIKDKIKTQDIPLDEMVKIKSDNSDIKQEISNKIIANSNNPKKLAVFLASIIKLPKEQLENLPHKIFENKNVIAHLDRGTLMSVVEGKNTKQKVAIKSALKGIANDPNFANLSSYQMDTLSAVEDYLHSGPGKNL